MGGKKFDGQNVRCGFRDARRVQSVMGAFMDQRNVNRPQVGIPWNGARGWHLWNFGSPLQRSRKREEDRKGTENVPCEVPRQRIDLQFKLSEARGNGN